MNNNQPVHSISQNADLEISISSIFRLVNDFLTFSSVKHYQANSKFNAIVNPLSAFFIRTFALLFLCIGFCLALQNTAQAEADKAAADELEIGRSIYMEGMLPNGEALTGLRFGNANISGAQAACVNCHRRSGMGQVEGDIQVQPITGKFLYANKDDNQRAVMDPRVSKFFNQAHDPYTDASLAEAIIKGKNNRGQEMNVTMPRYNLSELELKSVIAYLKQLSSQWSPGVTQSDIHFATVITPDVDPELRKVVVDMMQTIFRQKNGSTKTALHSRTRHHMTTAAELILGTERNWDLDVWELHGAPDTWGEQLAEYYRNQPVFALISGVSRSTWQPVHDFCEHESVPCWFPSVDLTVNGPTPYSLYFSRGVMLEADVLGRYLVDSKAIPKHLIQVSRENSAGQFASKELERALEGSSIKVENRYLKDDSTAIDSLRASLQTLQSGDTAVFWLRQDDIKLLDTLKPVGGVDYYFSSRLSNGEQIPLTSEWKDSSHLVYLYELPEKRKINLTYFHAWANMHQIPMIDEAIQSEVYFAMSYLTDTLSDMLNNVYRDYLVERAETEMDRREGSKAEQETRDRLYLGNPGNLTWKYGPMTVKENERLPIATTADSPSSISHGTTIYPLLSLGPDQRFASRGGYIVRFADKHSENLTAESRWIVP